MIQNNLQNIPDWLLEQLPYHHSWIDVGGKSMHVMEKGSGKPIVLFMATLCGDICIKKF